MIEQNQETDRYISFSSTSLTGDGRIIITESKVTPIGSIRLMAYLPRLDDYQSDELGIGFTKDGLVKDRARSLAIDGYREFCLEINNMSGKDVHCLAICQHPGLGRAESEVKPHVHTKLLDKPEIHLAMTYKWYNRDSGEIANLFTDMSPEALRDLRFTFQAIYDPSSFDNDGLPQRTYLEQ